MRYICLMKEKRLLEALSEVDDQFVEHGSTKELYQLLKLDKEGICESLLQALEQ